jgi:hypothetical protein
MGEGLWSLGIWLAPILRGKHFKENNIYGFARKGYDLYAHHKTPVVISAQLRADGSEGVSPGNFVLNLRRGSEARFKLTWLALPSIQMLSCDASGPSRWT